MQKILLYYKFTPISDPEAIKLWQKTLCDSLNLRGRILVSRHGLNGTVGGDMEDLKKYIKQTKQFPGFKDIIFKWSDGAREDFPRMSVKNRRELVGFKNSDDEFDVDMDGVIGGGQHLKPHEVNEMIEKFGDDVVFFDGRNAHEAKIGKFKDAIVPDTRTSRDFIAELESDKYDDIKDKKVITYCTGGVRCEVISAMMKKRGFKCWPPPITPSMSTSNSSSEFLNPTSSRRFLTLIRGKSSRAPSDHLKIMSLKPGNCLVCLMYFFKSSISPPTVPFSPCRLTNIRPRKFKPSHRVFCQSFIASGSDIGVNL